MTDEKHDHEHKDEAEDHYGTATDFEHQPLQRGEYITAMAHLYRG